MLEILIGVGSGTGYLVVAGTVYRKQYIRTFKEWRRWQAADPDKHEELFYDYHSYHQPRAKIDYRTYVTWKSNRVAPGYLALFWLPIGIYLGLRKVLQSDVMVPNYTKIKELEKLARDDD